MVIAKIDEKLKKVFFLEDEKLNPIVEEIIKAAPKSETIQIQLNIKGYENRKDPKMTKDIVFPHTMRRDPSVCIIGNASVQPLAEQLNVPFALVSSFEAKSASREREDLIDQYKYFILCADYQKAFNLRDILKKKKTHFMCPKNEQLPDVCAAVLKTYRLKVKDWFTLSFPVGHTAMPLSSVVENIKYGVQFVADNLKKGPQSLKDCFIKRTTGVNIKVY